MKSERIPRTPNASVPLLPRGVSRAVIAALLGVLLRTGAALAQQTGGTPPPPGGTAGTPGTAAPVPPFSDLRLRAHPEELAPLPPPPAGSAPPDPDPRSFNGIWLAPPLLLGPGGAPPKYTPRALQAAQYRAKLAAEGRPLANNAARCRPMNDIGVGADLFPAEIIQTPKEIVVLQEEGRGRWQIYLDRGHPRSLQPSFWGDSVGHWEGDTLVVDTTGFSGEEDMTTRSTHIVSRLHKLDGGKKLELEVTTSDGEQYVQPFTRTSYANWHPELRLLEFQCEENMTGAMEGLTPTHQ